MGGCTEELQLETSGTNGAGLDEGELTEAVLNLSVNTFAVGVSTKRHTRKRNFGRKRDT